MSPQLQQGSIRVINLTDFCGLVSLVFREALQQCLQISVAMVW